MCHMRVTRHKFHVSIVAVWLATCTATYTCFGVTVFDSKFTLMSVNLGEWTEGNNFRF